MRARKGIDVCLVYIMLGAQNEFGAGKNLYSLHGLPGQVFLSTSRCNCKIYSRLITEHQYSCFNIPENGSLQKEIMKSLTVPWEGFYTSPLRRWTPCRKSCSRMAKRREDDTFPFTPEFSVCRAVLHRSSLMQGLMQGLSSILVKITEKQAIHL